VKPRQILTAVLIISVMLTLTLPILQATANADSTQSAALTLFTTCDENGNPKFTFQLSDDVYVKGGWFPLRKNQQISIYVMPNGLKISEIDPAHATVGPVSPTVNSLGTLPITKIWSHDLKIGQYDIWIDVNKNGKFDLPDIIHFHYFTNLPLFHVVPETLTGSIGAVATMICAFSVFQLHRARKLRKP